MEFRTNFNGAGYGVYHLPVLELYRLYFGSNFRVTDAVTYFH